MQIALVKKFTDKKEAARLVRIIEVGRVGYDGAISKSKLLGLYIYIALESKKYETEPLPSLNFIFFEFLVDIEVEGRKSID